MASFASSNVGLSAPSYGRKDQVETRSILSVSQPVPGRASKSGGASFSLLQLVCEGLYGQLAVQERIVDLTSDQTSVLVVLDQVVVGTLREGQGVEAQGVHHRQLQELEMGI